MFSSRNAPTADQRPVVDLMDGLSNAQKRQVLQHMAPIDLRAGEVVASQGEHAREFYLLVDGSVEVTRDDTAIATIDQGSFFGEIGALTHARRNATVIASEDITVEVMNRRQLATVLDLWPELASQVQTAAMERMAG